MSEELDEDIVLKDTNDFLETLRWWEKRRIWYTLALLVTQVGAMLSMLDATVSFGIGDAVFGSLFYLFAANLCYCLGWGLEFLGFYYLKGYWNGAGFKLGMFIFGTFCSIVGTFIIYIDTLRFYSSSYF